jgi:cell division protein FtsB
MKTALIQMLLLSASIFFITKSVFFWEYGIYSYKNKIEEREAEARKIICLNKKIDDLEIEILSCKNDDLWLERAAREELLMSRNDEAIFYLFRYSSSSSCKDFCSTGSEEKQFCSVLE